MFYEFWQIKILKLLNHELSSIDTISNITFIITLCTSLLSLAAFENSFSKNVSSFYIINYAS